jgi:glutaredoxin
LLQNKGIPFEEVDVTHDPALRQDIIRRSGQRTVPQIFFDNESIGGFDELRQLNDSGELDKKLSA